jgi:Xaa-Pro aminopeptidase
MAQIKTQKEIDAIEKACSITDDIFKEVVRFLKKDVSRSEIKVRDFIVTEIKKRKLHSSFPPIVTSGPRAGNEIHPQSTDKKIQGFVIIDLGVRYDGYCSDMTRTLYVGSPSQKEEDLYEKVLQSQILGVQKSQAGAFCADIDAEVRQFLGPLKKYFIHTLGHGVGKKIHEPPMLYEKRTKPILKEGMVITIEPGIYIKNKCGIRIEDTIVVTSHKPRILTKTSKKLLKI